MISEFLLPKSYWWVGRPVPHK